LNALEKFDSAFLQCQLKSLQFLHVFDLSVDFIQDVCLYCQGDFGLSFSVCGTWPQVGGCRKEASVEEDTFVKRFINFNEVPLVVTVI
jgi:hypothetical protein